MPERLLDEEGRPEELGIRRAHARPRRATGRRERVGERGAAVEPEAERHAHRVRIEPAQGLDGAGDRGAGLARRAEEQVEHDAEPGGAARRPGRLDVRAAVRAPEAREQRVLDVVDPEVHADAPRRPQRPGEAGPEPGGLAVGVPAHPSAQAAPRDRARDRLRVRRIRVELRVAGVEHVDPRRRQRRQLVRHRLRRPPPEGAPLRERVGAVGAGHGAPARRLEPHLGALAQVAGVVDEGPARRRLRPERDEPRRVLADARAVPPHQAGHVRARRAAREQRERLLALAPHAELRPERRERRRRRDREPDAPEHEGRVGVAADRGDDLGVRREEGDARGRGRVVEVAQRERDEGRPIAERRADVLLRGRAPREVEYARGDPLPLERVGQELDPDRRDRRPDPVRVHEEHVLARRHRDSLLARCCPVTAGRARTPSLRGRRRAARRARPAPRRARRRGRGAAAGA